MKFIEYQQQAKNLREKYHEWEEKTENIILNDYDLNFWRNYAGNSLKNKTMYGKTPIFIIYRLNISINIESLTNLCYKFFFSFINYKKILCLQII